MQDTRSSRLCWIEAMEKRFDHQKLLLREGYELKRQKKHQIWTHPERGDTIVCAQTTGTPHRAFHAVRSRIERNKRNI